MREPTTTTPTPTVSRRTGRRIGYAVAILVNLVLYGIVNVWPGWDSFDFVTAAAADVLPIVNLSLGVSMIVNGVYLVVDRYRVKAFGETLSSAVAMAASLVVLDVFPFDFTGYALPWAFLTRTVLVIAILGSGIAVLVNVVRFIRGPRPSRRTTG